MVEFGVERECRGSPRSASVGSLVLKPRLLIRSLKTEMNDRPELVDSWEELPETSSSGDDLFLCYVTLFIFMPQMNCVVINAIRAR